jgi:hypothetical protein
MSRRAIHSVEVDDESVRIFVHDSNFSLSGILSYANCSPPSAAIITFYTLVLCWLTRNTARTLLRQDESGLNLEVYMRSWMPHKAEDYT